MLAYTDRQSEVKRGPAGCHGYCMSGPYALAAAARYPDRIAAASFYGTWLVSDAEESPHLSLSKVNGELYIACAEHDALAPLPMVEEARRGAADRDLSAAFGVTVDPRMVAPAT